MINREQAWRLDRGPKHGEKTYIGQVEWLWTYDDTGVCSWMYVPIADLSLHNSVKTRRYKYCCSLNAAVNWILEQHQQYDQQKKIKHDEQQYLHVNHYII